MPRSDWGERAKVGGLGIFVAAICGWTWAVNVPPKPNLPTYEYGQTTAGNYHPGGTTCQPQNLTRLTGQKGIAERERCAKEAEDHRLQSDDLVQQTRAADAAQNSAAYTYLQTRLMLLGVVLGIITLVAAVFAAIYARMAFLTQEHSFKLLARPFLYVERVKAKPLPGGLNEIEVRVKNAGASPATNLRARLWVEFLPIGVCTHSAKPKLIDLEFAAPGTTRKFVGYAVTTPERQQAINLMQEWLVVTLDLTFDSRFVKDKRIIEQRATWADDFLKAFWIPTAGDEARVQAAAQPDLFKDGEGGQEG